MVAIMPQRQCYRKTAATDSIMAVCGQTESKSLDEDIVFIRK